MQQPETETDRSEDTRVANKPREKMPISERAKQFMPFSALKGLNEALAQKEIRCDEMPWMSDEETQEINKTLAKIRPHDSVILDFNRYGRNRHIEGTVQRYDTAVRAIEVDSVQIAFDEIFNIIIKENKNEKD